MLFIKSSLDVFVNRLNPYFTVLNLVIAQSDHRIKSLKSSFLRSALLDPIWEGFLVGNLLFLGKNDRFLVVFPSVGPYHNFLETVELNSVGISTDNNQELCEKGSYDWLKKNLDFSRSIDSRSHAP